MIAFREIGADNVPRVHKQSETRSHWIHEALVDSS